MLALAAVSPAQATESTQSAAVCPIDQSTIVGCLVDSANETIDQLKPTQPHGLVATATYAALPLGSTFQVASACSAVAGGAAASVRITRCGVGRGATVGAPGPAAVIAGLESVTSGPTQICWEATATFVDGHQTTTSGCGGTVSFTTEDIPFWNSARSAA